MYVQISILVSSFDELVKKIEHLSVRVDGLEQVKDLQTTQLDNCLRFVIDTLQPRYNASR